MVRRWNSGMSWIERGWRTMRGSVIPGITLVVSESVFGFSGWEALAFGFSEWGA